MSHLDVLAKAGICIFAVAGDADKTVPYLENAAILEEKYKALGGSIRVLTKPGADHHPHGLEDPTPVVTFAVEKNR